MKRLAAALVGCLMLFAAVWAADARAEKTLRVGTLLLPVTQAAPFGSLNLPSSLAHQAIFDTLTAIGPDGSVQPRLALKWVAETPTKWAITLRDGVTFSNGEPLTSDAMVTAINYLMTPEGRSESVGSQLFHYTVTGVKARDRLTFEITTKSPDAILPLHLMFLRAPAPGAWRKLGPKGFAAAPVGTGPFVQESWADGKVLLSANPTSWRKPKLDKLEILQIPDQAARVQALVSGAIDVAYAVSPEARDAVEQAGGRMVVYRIPDTFFVAFVDTKDSPVKDVRVRRALNYAVNKQAIIDAILAGATKPGSQIAHPQSFGYNPDIAPYPYDTAKAKALLAEAGYPKGFKLPTMIVGGANDTDTVLQQVASDLAHVGVQMELRRITFAMQLEYVYQGGWPGLAFVMNTNGYDPMNGYRIRSCAWQNPYHCDPDIMPLIEAARTAPTPDERHALTQKVLAAEHDNPPGILMWQAPYFDGVAKRVAGYSATEEQIPFHTIDVKD